MSTAWTSEEEIMRWYTERRQMSKSLLLKRGEFSFDAEGIPQPDEWLNRPSSPTTSEEVSGCITYDAIWKSGRSDGSNWFERIMSESDLLLYWSKERKIKRFRCLAHENPVPTTSCQTPVPPTNRCITRSSVKKAKRITRSSSGEKL